MLLRADLEQEKPPLPEVLQQDLDSIVNEYRGEISLYHFDMYRIISSEELEATGFYDYPLEKSVFAVEWSENIDDILPSETIYITIDRIDDDTRRITVEGDDRFADTWN